MKFFTFLVLTVHPIQEEPSTAVLLVIDKSGSMAGGMMNAIKEGCESSAGVLKEGEVLGVLAFDSKLKWVATFAGKDEAGAFKSGIDSIKGDGGSSLYAALVGARSELRNHPVASKARTKHILIVSDGQTKDRDFEGAVKGLRADGVKVSTLCVMTRDIDAGLMHRIARWGDGKFTFVASAKQVAGRILNDVKRILK